MTRPLPPLAVSMVSLMDRADLFAEMSNWYLEQWPDWYGPAGPGDPFVDLEACCVSAEALPSCLVAVTCEGATPCGTVSLRDTSPGSDLYKGVWLTALLVPAPFRRRAVSLALIAAAEAEAKRLGFPAIHASTATAASRFRARNWNLIDHLEQPTGRLDIFRKIL